MNIPRCEHPNPQWERENWRSLNGTWEFDFDFGKSARDRKLYETDNLRREILVPFCPESVLSGIGYTDFINAVCYRKTFEISKAELSGRVILHFGAVDYKSYIYINKQLAKTHIGGYSSFEVDITEYLNEGENVVFVIAEDDVRSGEQPRGKQSSTYHSHDCDYTRTTGIWQSVWLEFVPKSYIKKMKLYPDVKQGALMIEVETVGEGEVTAVTSYEGKATGSASCFVGGNAARMTVELSELNLWELGCGRLYDLELKFGDDTVKSYFGMRSSEISGMKYLLNGKSVFQRLVLDQGFYPEGIYTAKSDEELKYDIELSMAAGFNGARLHQKVFEARFLYHCDKLGYMVWGEHGNWGMDYRNAVAGESFLMEWMEILERDFNHPSIIGWCPFNETWGYEEIHEKTSVVELAYRITKAYDSTRPCIDTSGNWHTVTDIFDVHDYEQNPEVFAKKFDEIKKGLVKDHLFENEPNGQQYKGGAVFVSEYGGTSFGRNEGSWGYGSNTTTEEEFIARYKGLTEALIDNPDIMGFCYTQLYDVEQEVNGLYTYERKEKVNIEKISKINRKKAAIED